MEMEDAISSILNLFDLTNTCDIASDENRKDST